MRNLKRLIVTGAAAAAIVVPAARAGAQSGARYKARLTAVPHTLQQLETLAGSGSATATLSGTKLTISGTFDGLPSAATKAELHEGRPGVPGPSVADLTISNATGGTITGTVTLTPAQVQNLQKDWLYIQLYSEKAPDGHLRGWLFPEESSR
jgi:CHRD domain